MYEDILCVYTFVGSFHYQKILRVVQTVDYYVPVDTDSLIHNIRLYLLYNSEWCTLDELYSFLLSSIYLVKGILKNCIIYYIPTEKNNINPQNKAKSFKKFYFYKKNDNYYQQ